MRAQSHQIVADYIDATDNGATFNRPPPTRSITHRVATVEAEIRLTLDYLALTNPAYTGGTLVEGSDGVSTKVIWDFYFDDPTMRSHSDSGPFGSGYRIQETSRSSYSFDSFGNLLYRHTITNDYGVQFGDKEPRIVKSNTLGRKLQFKLMLKLLEFRKDLDFALIT
jgi:hypothetical protein